ncbi:hypothetical protein [Streptomyces sp. NPDC057199]|uniref:hypothetical protein n=1 Tax=Streptomyces sp. NPDC057199 TaxID=3346047 RepID=UPI0036359542
MLCLTYTFEPTSYARERPEEMWEWMQQRELWFYEGLAMVRGVTWSVETAPILRIHHFVEFDDEAALAAYRRALADKGCDRAWEARRVEQDTWYTITGKSIQYPPPVGIGFGRRAAARPPASHLA